VTQLGSVSQLIAQFREGDEAALASLHRRYWPQVVQIARRKLNDAPLRSADEEDVAQQAFLGLYDSVRQGRAPNLNDRHQLLALLSHIVACKAVNEIKHELAAKRGQGKVTRLSPIEALQASPRATPHEEALLADCYRYYLDRLPAELKSFAELHLAGLTNREIAGRLDCVERTVERKVARLRTLWREMAAEILTEDVNSLLGQD